MDSSIEIIRQVSAMSYLGIFALSFTANVVVPVPEEVVILAIGYVGGTEILNFWIALVMVIVGSFVSDLGMFALSRNNNRFVTGFYNKFFVKIFPIDQDFLKIHSEKVVFFSRFLVQLRFLGPFIAGQIRMSWKRFIFWDLLALIVYVPILMWAGHYFAKSLGRIFDGINSIRNIVIVLAVLAVLWSLGKIIRKFFINKYAEQHKKTIDKKTLL